MRRIKLTDNRFAVCYEEVDGLCPLCSKFLTDDTSGEIVKRNQGAHIYPHSPTDLEQDLLKDVPRLSESPEHLDNIILLCSNCHDEFDKPRTVENYMRLYNIKKQIIKNRNAKKYYFKHTIEDEIFTILKVLHEIDIFSDVEKLSYNALKIKSKANKTMSHAILRIIENNVVEYYSIIDSCLKEIERDNSGITDLMASSIKRCYRQYAQLQYNQDEVFEYMSDWLDNKTQHIYPHTTQILISYYVQKCEVFSK